MKAGTETFGGVICAESSRIARESLTRIGDGILSTLFIHARISGFPNLEEERNDQGANNVYKGGYKNFQMEFDRTECLILFSPFVTWFSLCILYFIHK